MRKLLYLCLAGLVTLGCSKEKMVTSACDFELKVDWVKGSRAQFSVTPAIEGATYAYIVISDDHSQYGRNDTEIIAYQMNWLRTIYSDLQKEGDVSGSFSDICCFKGPRTIKSKFLSSDKDYELLVFQVNPETDQPIGPLYTCAFHTKPIPKVDLGFTVRYQDNMFYIQPEDKTVRWFWEYELDDKIQDVYDDPFIFLYEIIDMYDEYGFLEHALCLGDQSWELPRDDRSIKEGASYTLALSACTTEGEICSYVMYAGFTFQNGKISFTYADFPVESLTPLD